MADRRQTKGRVLLEVNIPGGWLLGVLAGLVVLLVIAVGVFSALNKIATCDVCHVIKPEVLTYEQTAHYRAGVGCQQCHTKPGVFNYFIRNLQGVSNLIMYVSNKYQRPITSYVGDESCLQCHPNSQIDKDIIVGNIRINHTGLREAGYQCLTCHANISHPGTRPDVSRVSQNPMSICARCHDGVKLPDTCSTCHVDGVPPANSPKIPIPLKLTAAQCRECHQQKSFCTECHHGLEMPHPAGWTKAHGQVVLDRGKDVCAACHTDKDPTFCIRCHGLPMPHPADWQTAHASVGQADPGKCVKCHGQNSCIKCHGLPMPHPADWLSTHPSTAQSSPSLCVKCHTSSFCAACHGVSLPHSSSFIANHPSQVYANGGVCVKCHGNNGAGPNGCYGGQCHTSSVP
ncbi:MAG: NapC/NirT family cytochrome c [Acidobacteriota bacterium]